MVLAVGAYIVGYCVVSGIIKRNFDIKQLLSYILILGFGLGVSAFFWMPAAAEMRYTNVAGQIGSSADFHNHFVCLPQLWDSPWGFGGSISGCVDGLSFKLGKLHILVAIIGMIIWLKTKKFKNSALVYSAILLFILSVALTSSVSLPLWEHIPGFAYIQYPWRFLSYAGLALSILGGAMVATRRSVITVLGTFLCVICIIGVNAKLFVPQLMYQKNDASFATTQELRFRASKVSDEYLPPDVERPVSQDKIVFDTITASSSANVTKIYDTAVAARYVVLSPISTIIRVNRAYFPGWHYRVNGGEVATKIQQGLPEILLPAGESVVDLQFKNTPVRNVGNYLSIIVVVLICIYYGKRKKTNA
jgi:hypothetical protein